MSDRYLVGGKTYFLSDLDMHREASRKMQVYLAKLPANKQSVFEKIVNAISAALKWDRLNSHIEKALLNGRPEMIKGNIYDLNRDIKRLLQKIYRWVSRNVHFEPDKVREFTLAIYTSGRSICRIFDRSATCWAKGGEQVVIEHVG